MNTNNSFDFLLNAEKMQLLKELSNKIHINQNLQKKIVFVFSAPKVGSTSLVSSLRIFGSEKISVIHIHDEEMLYILTKIKGVTINEIILYYSYIGKEVYVIDVYRSPIERKISAYFEKIGSYHFNAIDEEVNTYDSEKVIKRFNKIFPYIAEGDHFIDKYQLTNLPSQFDFSNKYLLIQQNGVKYIKLRLKDSHLWRDILTNIFNHQIWIVKDYESTNKPIKDIYRRFKEAYRIPINLLDDIIKCKYLNYYYSKDELDDYYNMWKQKSSNIFIPFTTDQYLLYDELTIDNCHFDFIQINHYIDEGCICKACSLKRDEIAHKILRGYDINENDKIHHKEAKQELISKRITQVNRFNSMMKNNPFEKGKRKNFGNDMHLVVNGLRK